MSEKTKPAVIEQLVTAAPAAAYLRVALDCVEGHHTGQSTTPGLEQAGSVAQVVDVGGVIQPMGLNQGSGLQSAHMSV